MKRHLTINRVMPLLVVMFLAFCPGRVYANGLLGDINGDKTVAINDVTVLINYLLAGGELPAGTPDVTNDGTIAINDVAALIDLLLAPSPNMTFVVNGVLFDMVPVEGGTFTMGSNLSSAMDSEKPAHRVTLSSFAIGETEVPQELWKAVMGNNPSTYKGDDLPVHKVTWNNCQKFIDKLNELTRFEFRFPTEAEWEYAARGGNLTHGYTYAGSNTVGNVAWYMGDGVSKPQPVATKAPNELGLYDMSGNVKEWCYDLYADYTSAAQTNPTGPAEDEVTFTARVNRGGAYSNGDAMCTVSVRSSLQPTNSAIQIGLRLALVLE